MWMVFLLVGTVQAQSKYADPDSPNTQAAARAALAHAKVLDIIGVSRNLSGVMEDLGAKVTDQEITIDLAADLLFDFDKYALKTEAIPSLQKVGVVVKA
jgi:outer membrane protein OmpA-like peptidoglycan-associated protein